jgi:methylated-DNA-[protein]-cysteine S-methyltransferase
MTHIEELLRTGPASMAEPGAKRATEEFLASARQKSLIDVRYAQIDSPVGELLVAATNRGLVCVAFPEQAPEEVLDGLARRVSPRVLEAPATLDPVRRQLEEYFSGARRDFELDLDWKLISGFARGVLKATAAIPFGSLSTYQAVAANAGSPRGSRAAGNALGSNPIPIVIPCHRVLRSGGQLGGYAGGPDRKRFLLELESAL